MGIPETVNVYEAKTHLSRLIDRALAGEEVVIGRAGKPLVRLVKLDVPVRRTPGSARNQIWMADDFDEPDERIIDAFWGEQP
ncbi:type II toxin-antitoxin system Phd/YefM family antitoxin [Euzebya sp.]|uniref:type II toxin-antitoxin system Phd/YefM family antitoxin n=1 Tax=Euzebya sp. TaxID=1971409 RepID=UPI00351602D0